MFANRIDAGQQLARALAKSPARHPLVLGLPRGGVIVAAEVARGLTADLNVILVKKLRAPGAPELAIGAVNEDGQVYLNPEVLRLSGADATYIESERAARFEEMSAQRTLYRRVKPPATIQGRDVILVDDGLATGSTMIAAVQATVQAHPRHLTVAVPVSPPDTLDVVRNLPGVDEVVCLMISTAFEGVGQFYQDFRQTSDAEVVALLKHEAHK